MLPSMRDYEGLMSAISGCRSYDNALDAFEEVYRAVYSKIVPLSQLISVGERCLLARGHIYYVGNGGAGLVGLIDASEQVPTFGAESTDVQGFISGGWNTVVENLAFPSHIEHVRV